jgi:hypothetical protein
MILFWRSAKNRGLKNTYLDFKNMLSDPILACFFTSNKNREADGCIGYIHAFA